MDKKKSLTAVAGALSGLAAGRVVDLALVAGGLATATGAVAFAGYMTMAGAPTPLVNGMEYLAIFAQPVHHGYAGLQPVDIDMNPVGAINPNSKNHVSGYALVGAQRHYAWLREGNRIFAVQPGDDVPRLGRVGSIEQRDGRWTLLDEKGAPLIVSAVADLTPSAGGRFDKRMIFGDEK